MSSAHFRIDHKIKEKKDFGFSRKKDCGLSINIVMNYIPSLEHSILTFSLILSIHVSF